MALSRDKLGNLFLGVTPRPQREYLRDQLERLRPAYNRVIVPCCGRFSFEEAAVQAGYAPEQVESCDVTLFSSIIGLVLAGKPLDELKIEFSGGDEFLSLNELMREHARPDGVALYGMKLALTTADTYYERQIQKDLLVDRDTHIAKLTRDVDELVDRLSGISYACEDMWDLLARSVDDPNVIVLVNPPVRGGAAAYKALWNFDANLSWADPKIEHFEPKEGFARLWEVTQDSVCLSITYRQHNDRATTDVLKLTQEQRDHGVFALELTAERVDFLIANRPGEFERRVQRRKETQIVPSKYPLIPPDHVITKDSEVWIDPTTAGVAMYSRDLFAHKLGAIRSENYFIVAIDGYLMGVFGLFFDQLMRGTNTDVMETFGFTAPHPNYGRLNKLFMMLITCEDARRFYQSTVPSSLAPIEGFQTSCISTHPEMKTNRGILKLRDRKERPDGRYHLNYHTPFHDRSYGDCIVKWLKSDGKVGG